MERSLDESSDNEEEFHSTRESPSFHGDLGPPALLAVQLVAACVALHQCTKSQHRTPGLPPYPLGLPHFPPKKKGGKPHFLHTEPIINGNLQGSYGAPEDMSSSNGCSGPTQTESVEVLPTRSQQRTCHASHIESFSSSGESHTRSHQQQWNGSSSDTSSPIEASFAGTQEQPWNAPTTENFLPKSSTSQTHVESFPLLRRRIRAESIKDHSSNEFKQNSEEDGFLVRVSMDKHLDRGSLKELQPKRRYVKRGLDSAYDGEGAIRTLDLCQDEEASSCFLDRSTLGSDEEGSIDMGLRRIADTDLCTIRELSEDRLEESSISSDNFSRSSSVFPLAHHKKRQPPFFDHEANECDDRQIGKQKKVDENLESFHTNIVSGGGSDLKDCRLHKSKDLEGSPADQIPEEGQLDSLLLWPVGLAVEAIAFQVRLVAQAFALIVLIYNWCNSFTSNRVRETLQAKERATEALSQKIAVITNVPPKVTESGSMVLKRAAWGCFAATYVCVLLSMLLFPALFLDHVFLSKIVEEPVSVKEPLHFDYTLPHPTATVFVHPSEGLQNSMGKFGSHQEHLSAIPIAHKVHVTVILTLPESDYNRNLGMFQLSAELLSGNGQSVKSSSRPCMLRFHSAPIRMLKTFLVSLPSLVGVFTESQTLVVHLMEFEEQHAATNAVRILLQPKAGMPLGQGIPEIYAADVHIESHLPWLKNLMRNWKWTIYIWTGLMLYVVEVIMVLCCCRQALLPKTWMGLNDECKAEQLGANTPAEMHESASLENQMPRKRRQRSLNEHIPTARAILERGEHKLRQGGSHSSI